MGGGAIRAAAKVAGITAATGAFRSIAAEHHHVSAAARKTDSVRSVTAAADDVKLLAANLETGVRRRCLEIDDWLLAEGEEVIAEEPLPRVVFSGVPTLQEAEEATSELSAALEKAYLSAPIAVGYDGSFAGDHDFSLSPSNKGAVETKTCVTRERSNVPAVTAPVIMAFRLLQENSAAKNVVSSIASDPNVWKSVLQNPELQEFLKSQTAIDIRTDKNFGMESVADYEPKSNGESCKYAESGHGGGFMDILQKLKNYVVDMMSSLSDYFQNLFGGKGAGVVFLNPDGTARLSTETFLEGSFIGLAIMVILVILLKRA